VRNRIDRFNLAIDVIDRVPKLQPVAGHYRERLKNRLIEHRQYVRTHGEDVPEVANWAWSPMPGPATQAENRPLREPV
jgi:xylulose-5-phosphate/fructose-6-phosphate phosphoketolase